MKTIRVFEAFAGIGAQVTALERAGVDFEIVGISEWFIDAVICYDKMHCNKVDIEIPSYEEQLKYLNQFQFSRDSINPTTLERVDKKTIERLYVANKRSKNYGSITQLKGHDMPDTDLLVYSFPCQDLSTGGKGLGMKKGSETRSGLLWEIERILTELNEEGRLPEYLLLENVRTILAPSHKPDLDEFLTFLSSLGYENDDCMVLNATEFGVPQDRERAFIVSHLKTKLNIPSKIKPVKKTYKISDYLKYDYDIPVYRKEADEAQLKGTPSREKMWEINGMEIDENTIVRTITCNMDRTHCAALFDYNGIKGHTYRRPTIREAFLLMGFTEEEYERTLTLRYSYRKMNKLIGNSIVVNVLAEIFKCMFRDK